MSNSNQTQSTTNNQISLPQLLTIEEVSHLLQISTSKLYLITQRGELPIVRFGRVIRVRPVDLQAFIEKSLSTAA